MIHSVCSRYSLLSIGAPQVHDELNRIMMELQVEELSRFHILRERINSVVAQLLRDCLDNTRDVVRNLLAMEGSYMNTDHPEFQAGTGYALLYGSASDMPEDDYIPPEQAAYRQASLTAVFKHLDRDGDDTLDLEEVKKWGDELRGRPYTPEEASKILKSFDVNEDNKITLKEWMDYHDEVIPGNYTTKQFDESLTNYLPKKKLARCLSKVSSRICLS